MPIYAGIAKLPSFKLGATTIKKVFAGEDILFAQMNLNFDEQGGSAVSNKVVVYGEQYGTLQLSSKSYYTFGGWSKIIGGASVYSSTIVDEIDDFTLYAKWNEKPEPLNFLDYISNTQNTLTYEVENSNPYSVRVYYAAGDSTPTTDYITVAAGSTGEFTVTGLSAGTFYTIYARCYSTQSGVYSTALSSYNTTQSAGGTNWVLTGTSLSSTAYSYNTAVTNSTREGQACLTTTALDTWLTGAYPPGNYSVGHVIRVFHRRLISKPSNYSTCGYYWFTNN